MNEHHYVRTRGVTADRYMMIISAESVCKNLNRAIPIITRLAELKSDAPHMMPIIVILTKPLTSNHISHNLFTAHYVMLSYIGFSL